MATDLIYDSTRDTNAHRLRVRNLMFDVSDELVRRGFEHDESKLAAPEKPIFDKFTPRLRSSTYGSEEYKGFLREMQVALDHHYAVNSHHPEHGETGIKWAPIQGYEGHYEVSTFGDVRSLDRVVKRSGSRGDLKVQGRMMKSQVTPKGYLRIRLQRDGWGGNYMVHRLVAEAFIENPEAKPEVNHKDGNKQNNHVGNLEWSTSSENQIHAYDTGLREPATKYVVHCPELDLTTFGTQKMEEALRARGYEHASAAGIWSAMDRGGKHFDLTFEGTLLQGWRRSRIRGMTLMDLVEMICDWKAATERHDDGDIRKSIELNQGRFGYSDELKQIFLNTIDHLGY